MQGPKKQKNNKKHPRRSIRSLERGEKAPIFAKMPGFVGISDFVDCTKEDFKNPTISSFADKIPQLKKTVNMLEEVSFAPKLLDFFPNCTIFSLRTHTARIHHRYTPIFTKHFLMRNFSQFQTIDYDREGLTKLKKATKAIINSGNC